MFPEIHIGYFFPETSKYLRETYPSNQENVENIIREVKENESARVSASTLLLNKIAEVAENEGVENLPDMLAAAIRLQLELPVEQRGLTPKRYVEYLLEGEVTSAHLNANPLRHFKDVGLHLARAEKLEKFLKDFE